MNVNASLRKEKIKTKQNNGHTTTRPRTRPRPVVALVPPGGGSLTHCLKCHGWIVTQMVDLYTRPEMRCLNCGWQPQYGERVIRETEEARSIRRFTAEPFGGLIWDRETNMIE